MLDRRRFIAGSGAGFGLIALGPRGARAATPETFAPGGIAINGHDPVAYFTEQTHVAGDAAHALDWKGARWLFASAAHRETFEADPMAYAPRYGGYCAYAMAHGAIAKTDPDAWTVYEGRLYLNYSVQVRGQWSQDIPGNIAKADRHWPGILQG